jgi:ABC-type multidrug transport system fused ATPase/permease subunit
MAPPPSDDRDESHDEKLDRNWGELLQELRITQTGLQLLAGFLLTLPFTQVFHDLDDRQKTLYLGLVLVAGLTLGVNMVPVMLHRRLFGEHVKERVVQVGHLVAQIVIAAIAVLVVGMATLIFSVVAGWTAGIVVAAFLAVVLGSLLGVLPERLDPH